MAEQPASCLSSDAFAHFQERERQLLAFDSELEAKKSSALAEASSALQQAESASSAPRRPPRLPGDEAGFGGLGDLASNLGDPRPSSAGAAAAAAPSHMTSVDVDSLHSTIRFQKARIIALQEELDKTIAELSTRDSEAQQLKQENRVLNDNVRSQQKMIQTAESTHDKLKKQLTSVENRVKDLEKETAELRKENDQLDLAKRKVEAENGTKDTRIKHLVEDCERYKSTLKDLKSQDKDRATIDRKETDRLTSEVRKLERQRSELLSAFKKQMKLIDVLKKQKAHIEAARVLSFTEEEFVRILELGEKLQ